MTRYLSVAVGLGEIGVSRDPAEILATYGLGSCVGIGMYDPVIRVAGLLHAVLPKLPAAAGGILPRYVDSGVGELLARLAAAGAIPSRLIVRLVGGAHAAFVPVAAKAQAIGAQNVAAARAALAAHCLEIATEEVGGDVSRTVRLYVEDGRMTVHSRGLNGPLLIR